MNDYYQKQEELFQEMEARLKSGDSSISIVSPPGNYETDNRLGLTILAFIPINIQERIYKEVINPLKKLDPTQYFYHPQSLHITIRNIRVINDPPDFDDKTILKAQEAIRAVAKQFNPITVHVKGLFELPYNLGLRVYVPEEFRNLSLTLQQALSKAGVPDNKQYASQDVLAGNITIVRYNHNPTNTFQEKIQELKKAEIGEFTIYKFSLLSLNAVLAKEKTRIIETYKLNE